MQPRLSVVVCAYTERRLASLERAVSAVRSQLSAGDQLVVVIDHDEALLARCRGLWGETVVASCHRPGLSGARNTGVAAADGEVVVFLDDDACPRPGWADRIRSAFDDPSVVALGTAVRARWASGAPRWFPTELGWVVGCDYRGVPADGATIRNPIGASMAVRADALARVGGFSGDLGRVGTLPVGCEETELGIRLAAELPEARIVRVADAVVDHDVPTDRATLRYVLRRGWHEGRSKAVLARASGPDAALASERGYLRSTVPSGVAAHLLAAVTRLDPYGPARAAVLALGVAATAAGYLTGRVAGRVTSPGGGVARTPSPDPEPAFVGVACIDVDTADDRPLSADAVNERGEAAVLVRDHGWPRAFLRLDQVSADGLGRAVKDALADAPSPRPEGWPWAGLDVADLRVSVVVCTLGRDPRLRATVSALLDQEHRSTEVVVVDNDPGSRQVDTLLAGLADPRLRVVAEPRRGLSVARNTGLAAATASVVAYTDDDALPDPDWLTQVARAFVVDSATGRPPACVTGLVVPAGLDTAAQAHFEDGGGFGKGFAPVFYAARTPHLAPYGGTATPGRRGPAFPYAAAEIGSGNNMAFRRDALLAVGGFDVALGAGSLARGGEDLDVLRTLYLAGETIVYVPAAVVRHHHRADHAALREQMYGYGVGMAASVTKLVVTRPRTLLGVLTALPAAVRLLLDPGSDKNGGRPSDYPADVARAEVRGYAAGPLLYLRSRVRAQRRGLGAPGAGPR